MEKSEKLKENFNTFIEYFWLFISYSFLGWLMEVCIFYFIEHRFINRGFLIGPICSIYGFGCIFISLLFGKYRDKPWKLFFLAALWSAIEYVAGYVLEVTFGGRWWQYTNANNFMNLNGRVWIATTIWFGILATALIIFAEPFLLKIIRKLPRKFVNVLAILIITVYLVDTCATSTFVLGAREKVESISNDCTMIISDYVWTSVKGIFK